MRAPMPPPPNPPPILPPGAMNPPAPPVIQRDLKAAMNNLSLIVNSDVDENQKARLQSFTELKKKLGEPKPEDEYERLAEIGHTGRSY